MSVQTLLKEIVKDNVKKLLAQSIKGSIEMADVPIAMPSSLQTRLIQLHARFTLVIVDQMKVGQDLIQDANVMDLLTQIKWASAKNVRTLFQDVHSVSKLVSQDQAYLRLMLELKLRSLTTNLASM